MSRLLPPAGERLVRIAVLLAVAGMLCLLPIVFRIGGLALGLFMIGSVLLVAAILLYLVAVFRELRERQAL